MYQQVLTFYSLPMHSERQHVVPVEISFHSLDIKYAVFGQQ